MGWKGETMIKVYIRNNGRVTRLEDANGARIDVRPPTVTAAANGTVTDALRRKVRAALNEPVLLVDMRD